MASAALSMPRLRSMGLAHRHVSQSFGNERLRQLPWQCWCRTHVGRLGRHFLHHLSSPVLHGMFELDFLRPSLVTEGAPNLRSMTTLRPLGPKVTLTALAKASTPALRLASLSE